MTEPMDMQSQDVRGFRPGTIAAGVILLAAGAAMYLDTTGAVDIHLGRLFPSLVLITIGTAMLDRGPMSCGSRASATGANDSGRRRRRGSATGGIWLIGVGAWMLVSQNHILGLTYHNAWPLLVVLGGVILVTRGLK